MAVIDAHQQQHQQQATAAAAVVQACSSMYVMLFEKDCVGVASRTGPVKAFVPPLLQMSSPENKAVTCCSMLPNLPVQMPPRPASGIVNLSVREALLQEYRKNPLVFTIQWRKPADAAAVDNSRHFLGFGFSSEMPYFPPGTILRFISSGGDNAEEEEEEERVTITGMAAAYGQRTHEYAVILSLDKPVHPDAISSFFMDSYNVTEIDGGDEGLCLCLANIIRKYTYTVGDVDPACASTEAMENAVASKFRDELERMFASVQVAISSACRGRRQDDDDKDARDRCKRCIANAFRTYRETLFLQMRHQPLGTREWIQMFESYMSFAASQHGLGFIDFVLY